MEIRGMAFHGPKPTVFEKARIMNEFNSYKKKLSQMKLKPVFEFNTTNVDIWKTWLVLAQEAVDLLN
jgi:hypothetical protein